jgi:hypothetical protein
MRITLKIPWWMHILFYLKIRGLPNFYEGDLGGAERREIWQGQSQIRRQRRTRDISYAPGAGKRYSICEGEGIAVSNSI